MACDCNTPTSSGGNTASTERAYLTNPVTAPAESCYTPPENPCAVPVSRRRYLVDFIPGWIHRLTGAAKGKMLVAVGDTLHFFKGDRPGPLYFDGHDVSVGEQSTLTTKANEASVVERGHLTLAKKVRSGKVLPDGSVVDVDYFEHGVQSVREIASGEMVGLTSDPASGSVRLDVIEPTQRDLVKKGIPAGMQRLGFVETLIDGVCGKVPAKEFLSYTGAVFGKGEILTNRPSGLPAILIPVNDANGETSHVIGIQEYLESDGVTAEEAEEMGYKIPVVRPIYGDSECPDKVTGYTTEYLAFPDVLLSGTLKNTKTWLDDEIAILDVEVVTGGGLRSPTEVEIELDLDSYGIPETASSLVVRMMGWVHGNNGQVSLSAGKFKDVWQAGVNASNGSSSSGSVAYTAWQMANRNPYPVTSEIRRDEDGVFRVRHNYSHDPGEGFELRAQIVILGYTN